MMIPVRLSGIDVAVDCFQSVVERENLRDAEPTAVTCIAVGSYVDERGANDRLCRRRQLRFGDAQRGRSTTRTNHI